MKLTLKMSVKILVKTKKILVIFQLSQNFMMIQTN